MFEVATLLRCAPWRIRTSGLRIRSAMPRRWCGVDVLNFRAHELTNLGTCLRAFVRRVYHATNRLLKTSHKPATARS